MNSSFIRAISQRPFCFLLLAEVFSQIPINTLNFVLIIVVFKLTHSNTAVSGIVLSYTIPLVIFGIIAGAFVDRWNKKKVLFVTNGLRAILLVLIALFYQNLVLLYILSFVTAIITQFFIPAETPMIPLLVRRNLLLAANALFGLAYYGALFIAFTFSGYLLISFSESEIFLILGFMFLVGTIFAALIKVPLKKVEGVPISPMIISRSIRGEIKTAWEIILKTKDISQSLLLIALSQVIVIVLAVIGPGYASDIIGITVNEFPLFFATPATVGMVIGAILIGNFFQNISKQKLATAGVLISALGILALPYGSKVASRDFVQILNIYLPGFLEINILHIMIVLAGVLGFANALVFVPSNTLIQEVTTDQLRGKIYGFLTATIGVLSLLPIIIVGELADIFGVSLVLTGIGIILFMFFLLRLAFHKSLK